MSARLSLGRTLAVAGIVTAVAVPLSGASAFAATQPHHTPVPATSGSSQPPAASHSTGHHMPVPGHSTSHHMPVPGHSTGHHPKPARHHHSTVTELRTRIRNAQVRMSPTVQRHGRALSVLHAPGSRVAVTCWTLGARENGSNTWYRTVAPARGYISSTEVARPAHPVGRCK